MGTRAKRTLVVTVVIAAMAAQPDIATACRIQPALHLEDLAPGEPAYEDDARTETLGVYEITYLAKAPGMMPIIRDRSAMIVTRYWGEPPPELGVQLTAYQSWRSWTDCGIRIAEAGTVTYWFTGMLEKDGEEHRIEGEVNSTDRRIDPEVLVNIERRAPVSAAQEVALEERWGPPVVLDISLGERTNAIRMLWQWHLLTGAMIIALIWAVRRWRRHRRGRVDVA